MQDFLASLPPVADGEDKGSALKNRVRKNYKHLRKWAKRTQTNCFRIYDREIHEYPLAIDFYAGRFCVHYFTRDRDNLEPPEALRDETNAALCAIFATSPAQIFWRTRMRREKKQQYEKACTSGSFFTVFEYGLQFRVNLVDYLDTGIFLDHRETRQRVAAECAGKRVLNLFAYTCAFTVHAARAGAVFTKSVDMSNTYTAWGRDNLVLNGVPAAPNPIVRADYRVFLGDEIRAQQLYDIIIIDPPTISRSKKMDHMFDIQQDHPALLSGARKLLAPGGVIFFSTNSRRFVLSTQDLSGFDIDEISSNTRPHDFHDAKIHRCWRMSCERTL